MKYIKTFEKIDDESITIGDYVKEFIPGYGYNYYKIISTTSEENYFFHTKTFYEVLNINKNVEEVYTNTRLVRWELATEKEVEEYILKKDSNKYNL